MRPLTALALTLLLLLPARPAPADTTAEPAIGRLNHAAFRDKRHCTMAAISPRGVATAAHCLRRLEAGDVHLLFGFDTMGYTHHTRPVSAHALGGDLAVLCLGEGDAAPAHLRVAATPPKPGDAVRVTGYARPKVQRQHEHACHVAAAGARIVIDCEVLEGGSGAPVRNAAGEVVAVVSSRRPGATTAIPLPPAAAALCESGPAK